MCTDSLKKLGRSVGRSKRPSIVNQVMKSVKMRTLVASKIGNLLKREIMNACSKNTISLFNDKSVLV